MNLRLSLACLACGLLAAATQPDSVRMLDTAPLRFEPATDDGSARFVARGARFRFSFTGNQAVFQAGKKNVRLQFEGAASTARIEALEKLRSTTGVFIGNDPAKWRRAIPNYGHLQVRDLYPGVDLVYYGNAGELEYDLTLKPGVDPRQIRLRLGGGRPRVDRDGSLVAGLIQKHPVAYQITADGKRIPVESRYRRNADGTYGFTLGRYDHGRDLVIDPVLALSAYLSGSKRDIAYAIGHDTPGFLYVAGTTASTDFPMVGNSTQATLGGSTDVFLVKIDPNAAPGSQVVYSTFIGGVADDILGGMAVGPKGDVYLTGNAASGDFPSVNGIGSTFSGTQDAFVVWIDSSQNLAYSTLLGGGGKDTGLGITFDSQGKIYVTGGTMSDDFPNTGGFQTARAGGEDAFLTILDPSQSAASAVVYSTYLGGGGWDIGRAIALAPDGTVWIAGGTYSFDFPVAGYSYQPLYQTGGDAFVAQIHPALGASALAYVTFLGGSSQEEARNVVVDATGRVIVSGWTLSPDFPVTPNALQTHYGGNTDVFVSILNTANPPTDRSAQLIYSTYFGGSNPDVAFDLKQDASGNLYLAGLTLSAGLAASANALQSSYDQTMDAFALILNPSKPGVAGLSYFSYLGSDGVQIGYGIDFNPNGNLYLVGFTSGPIFDSLGGAAKTSNPGKTDAFVVGFSTAASQ